MDASSANAGSKDGDRQLFNGNSHRICGFFIPLGEHHGEKWLGGWLFSLISQRIRLAGKIVYPVDSLIEWLESRAMVLD